MKEAVHYGRFVLGFMVLLWVSVSSAALTVGNLQLVGKQRVSRTVFEFTYKADLVNTGPAVQAASAAVSSSAPGTVIVDGQLSFGDVAAGATVTSTDTFSFRQNRRVAFDPAALSFVVSAMPVTGDTIPPQVTLLTPNGAQVDTASLTITGTATDDTQLAGVTINGSAAVLSGNTFALSVALTNGDNLITAVATDAAGNTASASLTVTRIAPLLPPQISALTPDNGPAGSPITITGSRFVARSGVQPVVTLSQQGGGTVSAPVSTFDATTIAFTLPAAATSGHVTVTVNGQTATSPGTLTVTPSSDFTLSPRPASVALIQGATASLDVRIRSTNGFSQTVALTVSGVPTGITAKFNPARIAPGQSSTLSLSAPAGQPVGAATLRLSAAAVVDGIALTKTADVTLAVQPVTTSFIGRTVVADPAQTPLAGVTVKLLGLDGAGGTTACTGQTRSDAAGNFAFTNLPAGCVGAQLIRYDGSTVTAPAGGYAGVDLVNQIVDGQVTAAAVLIHLPRIDNGETVNVIQNHTLDQTFRFSTIPNLSVTVYAGTTLTLKDGSQPDPFPLTAVQVPIDRLPDEPPAADGLTPFIVAFQPANATASQPIAVTFPNLINTPPGTNVTLMTLDPTLGKMVSYGTGTVSNNGLKIVPDADPANPGKRFGLVHFDWHGPAGPTPNKDDPCPCGPGSKNPIDFASGLEVIQGTDVAIPAPGGGVSIQRTYRTLSSNAGPFGIGGNHNYSYFLSISNPGPTSAVINYIVPAGNQFPFANNGGGTFTNRTEPTLRGMVMQVNNDGSVDVTFKDRSVFHFVPGGFRLGSLLQSITDPNGNKTTLTRNPSNPLQITEIIDSVGRKLKLSYSGNRITQISDPIGRVVKYTYTRFGRLQTVTDPEGGVTRYAYNRPTVSTENDELATVTDARGVVVVQNFYGLVYGPACKGATGLSDDDLAALPQAQRDACLNDPRTVRDQRVWKQQLADGGVMRYHFTLSNASLPLSPAIRTAVTDALGSLTAYRFSTQSQTLAVTDPLGQRLVFDREPGGNLILGKHGNATCAFCGDIKTGDFSQTRDENGNILTRTDALGNVSTFTYDLRFNKPTTITDALGNVTLFSYDSHGNLLSMTDANGQITRFSYNSRGLPVEVTDAAGSKTALSYDAFGNLVKTTDALGNITRLSYDAVGRLIETLDPLGRRTQLTYDKLDRLVAQTDAKGKITTFSYDPIGNLLSVTDPKSHTVSFTYDVMGRVGSRTDAAGKTKTFAYDLNGNLIRITDRKGQVSVLAYDRLNRLVKETYADGSTVANRYDARGRLVRVVDSIGGVQTFRYDALGRLSRETAANGTLDYQYDALGRALSRQVVGQPAVSYTYDPVGNLLKAADSQASVDFTYDALNRRTQLQRANGVTTTQSYDALSRVLGIVHKNATGNIDQQTYNYDKAGNRTSLDNSLGAPYITATATAQYDAANRLIKRGDTTYTYDQNGNRTGKTSPQGATTYRWDSRNRLTKLTEPNGTVTRFTYDAFNNLITQQVTGPAGDQTTGYLTDDLTNVVRQTDSNGTALSILTGRGIDDALAVTKADGTQDYLARDGINSTTATTDGTGALKQTFSYEPYGQSSIATTTTTFPIQYTGRLPVADGLYYYRARFYDPQAGRFLSEDPIGLNGGLNTYGYVNGNPVNLIDPLGLLKFNFSAGFLLPISAGVAVGPVVSSTFENGDSTFNGVGTEAALGVIANAGVAASIGDLDNNGCDDGAPFTINFGLGPRAGIQIRPRKTQNRNLSIFNPARFIDEISFGIGVGISSPISVSGSIK